MPLVHIETQLLSSHRFQLIQTWIDDDGNNLVEQLYDEKHDDRMYAAMTNLGYACRWLNDSHAIRGAVCIVSDRDGKDKRYNGEHDDLYEAIHSEHEYQRNRAKYGLIYGKYLGYLDRIRDLANVNEITFTQSSVILPKSQLPYDRERDGINKIVTLPVEPVKPVNIAEYREYKESKLLLHLKLSLNGDGNYIACRVCRKRLQIAHPFKPYSVPVDRVDHKGRTRITSKYLKDRQTAVKWFQEMHWNSCIRYYGLT